MPIRKERFPQLGGEAERYQVTEKATGRPKLSEAGQPETALRFPGGMPDIGDPETFRAALSNFLYSIERASPGEIETGTNWYPKVNEAVRKGIRGGFLGGHSDRMLAGAGIVAAVSPNMDWERNNINAFKELRSISSANWDRLMAAPKGSSVAAKRERFGIREDITKGMSIHSAALPALQKAGRIIHFGEDVEDVMSWRTGPKTHSFMHNIADPSHAEYVTVDGRAFDTMTNRMRPWEAGRGIDNAGLVTSGRQTRYEHSRNVIIQAARDIGWDPSRAQAVSWEHIKQGVERQGGARKVGPHRLGQPYYHPRTGQVAAHVLGAYSHLQFSQFASQEEEGLG